MKVPIKVNVIFILQDSPAADVFRRRDGNFKDGDVIEVSQVEFRSLLQDTQYVEFDDMQEVNVTHPIGQD